MVRTREEMAHYDYYDKAKFKTQEGVKDYIKATKGILSDFRDSLSKTV